MKRKILTTGLFAGILGLIAFSASPVQAQWRPGKLIDRIVNGPGGTSYGAPSVCDPATGTCGPITSTATMPVPMSAANVAAARHPIAHQWVRIKLTAALVAKGHTRSDAKLMAESLSDEMIEQAGAAVGAPGGFFQRLLAALEACRANPDCSKFIDALMAYLIALLGG